MGFNKRYLPELEDLKKIHQRFDSDEEFLKFISGKADAILGPSESHRYMEEVFERVKSAKETEKNKLS